jgi:hypothetical protein
MRRFLLSLGGAAAFAGTAAAQFGAPPPAAPATPAVPAPAAPFGNPAPAAPPTGTYVPPVGGIQPRNSFSPAGGTAAVKPVEAVQPPLALGTNHPLAVKPEDGAYFICVRSYSRPHIPDANDKGYTVKELAEALAGEIQQTHRTRVYLYELISDEKKAQAAAQTAARQRAAEFRSALEQYKQRAALSGSDFIDYDEKVKYQTFHFRDQVAVLIGGFRTEDEAVKALKTVKTWPSPKDTRLMDGASIVARGADGKTTINKSFINPYPQAMVVQNPAIAKQLNTQPVALDPFIVKLNEGRPYSLLNTTKRWTLAVKSFSAPVHYSSKDEEASVMKMLKRSDDAEILQRSANQAEALAKALREMKDPAGTPLNIPAYVLHTRTASLVTVGEYDAPNDPDLLDKQRKLSNLTFNLSRDDKGREITGTGQKFFGDMIQPVPIPRH